MAVSERQKTKYRLLRRRRRQRRVAKKVVGSEARPRLTVVKTHKHLYTQLIVDPPIGPSRVLTGASTLTPSIREKLSGKSKTEKAKILAGLISEKAKEKGITKVVFDRSGYPYHGVIKAFADAVREAGLEF